MADSNSQVTTVELLVDETEKTSTIPGNLTNYVGGSVNQLFDVPDSAGTALAKIYQLSAFTTGAVLGLTVNYHYRRVVVPNGNTGIVIPNFFTNVDLSLDNSMFVKIAHITDEAVYYDVFYLWSLAGTTSNLDLYVDTNRVPDEDISIDFPTFPNTTDPVRGANAQRANAGNDRIVDSFFLAQP